MSTAPLAPNLTLSAAKIAYDLLQSEEYSNAYFRLAVTGGGCGGMQYDIKFDERIYPEEDFLYQKSLTEDVEVVPYDYDQMIAEGGYRREDALVFLVDAISLNYLSGATIDYRINELGESEFVINNPNAKTSCGCGSSFSAELPEEGSQEKA
jgi:iron-sulfur cluster insertion protein